MATRITPDDVKEIIDTEETNLMPFIKAANVIVDRILADDDTLTGDQLEQIELWLSAHFLAIKDPVVISESIGSTSVSYWLGSPSGAKGLMMTPYGQMACTLDTSGRLTNASKKRASFTAFDLDL